MSKRLVLFALWCLLWSTGGVVAAYYGWSPYAHSRTSAGGPGPHGGHGHGYYGHGGYGGGYFFGPTHK